VKSLFKPFFSGRLVGRIIGERIAVCRHSAYFGTVHLSNVGLVHVEQGTTGGESLLMLT
jgi:hypothetical protein